jgi:DNA repair exonuclease SbcCD nuclease subunit
MSRIILLGDLHMGARSGDIDFANYFNLFFTDVLYPYMKKHGISTVIQAGDYFDNQNALSYNAWKVCRPVWVDKFLEEGWNMFVLVGNHDIAYKNTLRVNSPELILADIKAEKGSIQVIKEPTTLDLDGYLFDVVPWICKQNNEAIHDFISKQTGSALIGHFAIQGFPMYKGGQVEKRGTDRALFDQYPFVFSGHFHTKSESGNIQYLGVPYEITWADFNDPKGFHVFDTVAQTLDFVVNPYNMFEKILYEDGLQIDPEDVRGKIVRLVVTDRGNLERYNAFVDNLKTYPVKSLDIVESVSDKNGIAEVDLDEIDWVSNTEDYLIKVVDSIETDLSKEDLSDYMIELQKRAISL